jgi:sporulation-control protein
MVFKQMLSAFGVGGPSVDTMLVNPNIRPGLALDGQVSLRGGDSPVKIEQVTLALVTRVEEHGGDTGYAGGVEFHRMPVSGPLHLDAGQELSFPFQLPVPWEIPITDVYGQQLHGMAMGLRTEVAVARAVDRSDLDQIAVHPLPVQEMILEAFARLGFQFKSADLEHGRIYGVQQTLPFYQEIEFNPAPQYAPVINQLELTFVGAARHLQVVLEIDKPGGVFTQGRDAFGRFTVDYSTVEQTDWVARLDGWLRESIQKRGLFS